MESPGTRNAAAGGVETKKRESYLSWDDYFMAVVRKRRDRCSVKDVWIKHLCNVQAFLSAQRSKDPHTQVGACIVNKEKKIVGIGYNGCVAARVLSARHRRCSLAPVLPQLSVGLFR